MRDGARTRDARPRSGTRPWRVDRTKLDRRVRSARSQGIRPTHVFRHAVGGFSARLTAAQVRRLEADPAVASVEIDSEISIADNVVEASTVTVTSVSPQRVTAGLKRIGANKQPLAHIGAGTNTNVDIAVIDTGIAPHPDLRIAGGIDCTIKGDGTYKDRQGHGTHVAGILGARDNGVGVVGVVPGARLWAIKSLGDDGKGLTSELVCGLDWLVGQQLLEGGPRFTVANMSIAGPLDFPNSPCAVGTEDTTHLLMCAGMAAGITFAVAAANDSRRLVDLQPAVYKEPITVGAMVDYDGKPGGKGRQADVCPWYSSDADDTFANFSNWGAAVDIIAPGKCVLSTYTGKRYAWMSGTSMATPYVAGAVALYRMRYPDATPAQVKRALIAGGTLDWRTSTSPDGRKYRLVQVRTFTPPPVKVAVPTVRGMTPARAREAIRAVGLTVQGPVLKVSHASVPEGRVVNTKPSPMLDGKPRKLLRGTAVQIKVSTGPAGQPNPASAKVAVPKVRGMTTAKAREAIRAAGLKVQSTALKVRKATVRKGLAVNTKPSHMLDGKVRKLARGTTIQLKVSTGP